MRHSIPRYNIVTGTVTRSRYSKPFGWYARRMAIVLAVSFVAFLALGITVNAVNGDWTGTHHPHPAICDSADWPEPDCNPDTVAQYIGK